MTTRKNNLKRRSNFLLLIFFSFLSFSCNVQSAHFSKPPTPLSGTHPECHDDESTTLREIEDLKKEMQRIQEE